MLARPKEGQTVVDTSPVCRAPAPFSRLSGWRGLEVSPTTAPLPSVRVPDSCCRERSREAGGDETGVLRSSGGRERTPPTPAPVSFTRKEKGKRQQRECRAVTTHPPAPGFDTTTTRQCRGAGAPVLTQHCAARWEAHPRVIICT